MLIRALASHRILFAIAGVHWGGGIAVMTFARPWALVILLAALALTILGGQRHMVAQYRATAEKWREQQASQLSAYEVTNIEQALANEKLAGALLELAGNALSPRGLRDTGALRTLRAVEDARSEPAG